MEDTFAGHSKAALIQESEQLEAEIAVLSADLEQLQKALGGLNVKRECWNRVRGWRNCSRNGKYSSEGSEPGGTVDKLENLPVGD